MTDPRRLIDETDDQVERLLLQEARSYRASGQARHGALAALGLVSTAMTVAKASAAATSWSVKAWFAAGVVVGAAATGVTVLTTQSDPAQPPTQSAVVAPVPTPPAREATPPSPPAEPAVAPSQPAAAPPEAAPAPKVSTKPRPSGTTQSKEPSAASTLSEEVAALDAAQTALQAGSPGRALRLLDAHAARFPRGRLGLEAEVVRIQALARAGNRAAAAARARGFLERHPNSVLAPRVRRYAGR